MTRSPRYCFCSENSPSLDNYLVTYVQVSCFEKKKQFVAVCKSPKRAVRFAQRFIGAKVYWWNYSSSIISDNHT
jgi:hypothetical protein